MTGMDALVHAIEAATNRHAGPESDVAALAAIRLVMAHLPNAVREPQNLSARAGMLDAAALGGLAIHKAGTALAHNIGHALGSLAPVPHGLAVTLAMAATAEWVVEGNREGFRARRRSDGTWGRCRRGAGRIPAIGERCRARPRHVCAPRPELTAETLARHMAAPENAAMRKSTKRFVRDEDLLPLAEMTLALGRR